MSKKYQMCCNCVMDNVQDTAIKFDENGMCDSCKIFYNDVLPKWNYGKGHEAELKALIAKVKESGKGKKYDCLIGFSGGLDSAYLLHMAVKEWGLRPLVFHIDSGFNLPVGTHNVEKMAKKLDVELHIEHIDKDDMRNFQIAAFRTGLAGVLDTPQDHAFIAILDEYAVKHGIKYILNGYNTSTEAIANPDSHGRGCGKSSDKKFIKDVLRQHSPAPLKNYQFTNVIRRKIVLPYLKGVHVIKPLNLIPYVKKDVVDTLVREYGYEPYEQKHFESLMTKFLEGYWQPKRFGFDVRNHQLSSLIITGQMTRDEALGILKSPPLSEEEGRDLFKQIADKLEITEEELQEYMVMTLWENDSRYKTSDWMYKVGGKIMFSLGMDDRIRK